MTIKREVIASEAVVSSNHPLASAAGLQMLARGGNAVDAAIATAFALTVVEPMMVSIFGAGMMVIRDGRTGEVLNIDNYAKAPAAARPDMYEPAGGPDPMATVGRANEVGYRAVGVPGALPAWAAVLQERGRLPLQTVMAPAISYAVDGFAVSPYLHSCISLVTAELSQFPASAAVFLPGGDVPAVGDRIVRTDYARTLERIACEGPGAFTEGAIAEAVAADMAKNGGLITREDLSSYRFARRTPVRGTYRDYEVVSAAPTSSGGTHIVQVLNILEGFALEGKAQSLHLIAEALKIAFADRFKYMGDPDFVDVPVAWLTDKGYAAQRRAEINPRRASSHEAGARPRESADTTHLTVMDKDGNVVAMTQTLHAVFGSKVTVPGTGMLLNNTMWLFDPRPGRANSIAPGKRMLSSMSPTIVLKDGKPLMALGTPGGTRIFAAVLQAIVNVIDHGMTLQEAVEAPRIWTDGGDLEVEEGVPASVRSELEGMGHHLKVVPRVAGGMNGVLRDPESGLLHGAACWRADGTPLGMSGGFTEIARDAGVPA
jgi:gamma-glutamyltranspeptidase/glutathione hydrolase